MSGSFGSHTSCLYPDTVLKGDRSTCEFTGITFAGKRQFLDTGSKVEALGKDVSMTVNSKSISKAGGTAIYRGVVYIGPNAKGTKGSISCESLMLDNESRSDTIPDIVIENDDIKRLKSLPGIGAKTAGQIVLDLKGKFVSLETSDSPVSNPVWTQVQDALLSLGYKTNQLTKIKKEFENTELGEDEMLRQALILLAKRNGV